MHLEWRGRSIWLGGLYVGAVGHWGRRPINQFRGWLMSSEEGEETGWYETEEEAKKDVEAKAAMLIGPSPQGE